MKEIIIIIISVALVWTGAYVSQNYLTKTSDELVNNIEDLKIEIQKAKKEEDSESIALADDIYNKWKEIEEKWSIIITHDELDLIEISLIGMKTCIEEKQYAKSIEELEKSIYLLEHIKDKEKFDLKNIF
mgnify:CR=1 FL=1